MNGLSTSSKELLAQLSHHEDYQDPFKRVNWLRLNRETYWLPEEALSLIGVPEFEELSESQRKLLSQLEFLHTLEAGLWLEGLFMERLSRSACYAGKNLALLKFHLNQLREEAGHSLVFAEIIHRSGLARVPTQFSKLSWMNRLGRYAPMNSMVFWLAVMVGEEIPDRLNRFIRQHRNSICPAIYDVATFHAIDEARHISFSRRMVAARAKQMSPLRARVLTPMLQRLLNQFLRRYFYPEPGLYDLAGLSPGVAWATLARNNPQRLQFVRKQVAGVLRHLNDMGFDLRY